MRQRGRDWLGRLLKAFLRIVQDTLHAASQLETALSIPGAKQRNVMRLPGCRQCMRLYSSFNVSDTSLTPTSRYTEITRITLIQKRTALRAAICCGATSDLHRHTAIRVIVNFPVPTWTSYILKTTRPTSTSESFFCYLSHYYRRLRRTLLPFHKCHTPKLSPTGSDTGCAPSPNLFPHPPPAVDHLRSTTS